MSESPADHAANPEPSSPEADQAARTKRKRIFGFIAVVVFVAGGFFLFGPKVPREVHLRFDVPPVATSTMGEITRARMSLITAVIADVDGTRAATVSLPLPNGLTGPRTPAMVLSLTPGKYLVRARVRSFEMTEATLEGAFEAERGEVVVELK